MKIFILVFLINTHKILGLNQIPCFIDESQNTGGPSKCQASIECKGQRKCNLMGFCFGDDHCEPERKLGNLYRKSKCNITENKS